MRDEAEKRIGHLYPKVEITAEMAKDRPDLKPLVGQKLTVIAWIWARTVKSPNPAFANVDVPLVSTFLLASKPGKEAYVETVAEPGGYRFAARVGRPKNVEASKEGTKLSRGGNFRCVMSGTSIAAAYIRAEGKTHRMGSRLMAVVGEGDHGRVYADLSDFFYIWQRRSLRHIMPELFATLAVPKSGELVATPYRHVGKRRQRVSSSTA